MQNRLDTRIVQGFYAQETKIPFAAFATSIPLIHREFSIFSLVSHMPEVLKAPAIPSGYILKKLYREKIRDRQSMSLFYMLPFLRKESIP